MFFRLACSISANIFFALSSRFSWKLLILVRWNLYAVKPNPSFTIPLTDLTDIFSPFAILCTFLRGFLWSPFFAIFTDLAIRADKLPARNRQTGCIVRFR